MKLAIVFCGFYEQLREFIPQYWAFLLEMALIYYQEYIRVCGKLKKSTADCNFIELATRRINELNPKLKLELPKIIAQKDSIEVAIDTVRHD